VHSPKKGFDNERRLLKMSTQQKNLRPLFNFLICLIVMTLTVTPIFLTKITGKVGAEPKGVIRIGLVGEIDPLNPNDTVNRATHRPVEQVFEQLIKMDFSGNFQPCLATSWEITPDGKAITFNLRRGVKFHDGSLFNARAVKVSFDRIEKDKLKRWPMFAPILKSTEVINDYTVKLNLKGLPSTALTVLSIWGFIESPAAIERYGKDIRLHPSGTGLFKFVEWVPDQRVVLEANRDYWGGEPKISQVIYKPVPDRHTRLAMIEAKDLDVAEDPPFTEIKRLKSNPEVKIVERRGAALLFLAFNTVNPPFDDKRVRQAISYSIDRKNTVNTLLFGLIPVAETFAGPIVKHIFKYDIYPYNPEKAKSILASLGWKLGKSGFLEKDGEVFKTAIVTPSGRYLADRQIAEAIQAQIKKIGIDAKIIVLEASAFIKTVNSGREAKQNAEYGMLILIRPMGPDPDSAFTQHFHSKSIPPHGMNASIFVNSELDSLLEEGATLLDEAKRSAVYKKAQDILYDQVPWLPIYNLVDFALMGKGVQGVGYINPFSPLLVSKDAQMER
jgi:peptide/nickel transport system substrate-binding protein